MRLVAVLQLLPLLQPLVSPDLLLLLGLGLLLLPDWRVAVISDVGLLVQRESAAAAAGPVLRGL